MVRHRGRGCPAAPPEIGAAVVEQHIGVVDHAAVDPGHGESHADQKSQADAGEDKLARGMEDVTSGEADHGRLPSSAGSILIRSCSGFLL